MKLILALKVSVHSVLSSYMCRKFSAHVGKFPVYHADSSYTCRKYTIVPCTCWKIFHMAGNIIHVHTFFHVQENVYTESMVPTLLRVQEGF